MRETPKILITGGHMTPALAIASELKKRGFHKIFWVGNKHNQAKNKNLSPEYLVVKANGYKFIELKTGKFVRNWGIDTFFYGIKQLLLIPIGLINAFLIILMVRPKIIISFGGFLTVPIVIFGKIFGCKIGYVWKSYRILKGIFGSLIS